MSARLCSPDSVLWIIQCDPANILEEPLIRQSPGQKTLQLWASTCTQRTTCLIGYLSLWHRDAPIDETTVKLIVFKLTACRQGPPRLCKAKGKRGWRPRSSRLRLFSLGWWSTSPLISLRLFAHWCGYLFMVVGDHSLMGTLSHLHSFTTSVLAWHDPSEMEPFLRHLAFSPKPLNVCHINLSVQWPRGLTPQRSDWWHSGVCK